MTVKICDTPGCTGHIAKFDNCLDEAIYTSTLDGTTETTGSTEMSLWMAYVPVTADDRTFTTPDYGTKAGRTVTAEIGAYIVTEDDRGNVTVTHYPDATEARKGFDQWDTAYSEWLDRNDEENA